MDEDIELNEFNPQDNIQYDDYDEETPLIQDDEDESKFSDLPPTDADIESRLTKAPDPELTGKEINIEIMIPRLRDLFTNSDFKFTETGLRNLAQNTWIDEQGNIYIEADGEDIQLNQNRNKNKVWEKLF